MEPFSGHKAHIFKKYSSLVPISNNMADVYRPYQNTGPYVGTVRANFLQTRGVFRRHGSHFCGLTKFPDFSRFSSPSGKFNPPPMFPPMLFGIREQNFGASVCQCRCHPFSLINSTEIVLSMNTSTFLFVKITG